MKFVSKNGYAGIKGSTIIDHRIRTKLNLNCAKYCILDFVSNLNVRKKLFHIEQHSDEMYKQLGFYPDQLKKVIAELIEDEMLIQHPKGLKVYEAWINEFGNSVDKEFADLWEMYGRWGNRKNSLEMYTRARKEVSFEHLEERVKIYLAYLEGKTQTKLHFSTFLNPVYRQFDNEHYNIVEKPKENVNFSL